MEEPVIIRMTISHYGAMLKLDLDAADRATLQWLLAEAERELWLATGGGGPRAS